MRSTENCSDKLSREHYISKAILEQFDRLKAGGFPWQESDEDAEYGVDALTAKVLCTRHNSSLSPLDAAASHAFSQITDAMAYATKRSLARLPAFFLVSGDALELWGIKTLLGLYTAKIASADNAPVIEGYELDYGTACGALAGVGLNSPLGLYVHHEGTEVAHRIGVAPLLSNAEMVVGGLRASMCGVIFDLVLDTRGGNPQFFNEQRFYRPWVLDLNGPRRTARIFLTWASQRTRAVRVSVDLEQRRRR